MKRATFSLWLPAFLYGLAGGCVAQSPTAAQGPTTSPEGPPPNPPIPVTLTCGEWRALLAGERRAAGLAILWLDGYYAGRAGLPGLPAGWVRTVSQGVGGTCAISANDRRTVLDVIGQLHRDYGSQR